MDRSPAARLALVVATGLGVGYFPVAPGTIGTLVVGAPVWWGLAAWHVWIPLAAAALLFPLAAWAAGRSAVMLGKADPSAVVIDEVVGFLVAACGVATGIRELVLAFTLFRLFDVWKPWPVRVVDRRMKSGVGIVLDDVVAGIYARAALEILLRILPA